MSDEDFNNMQVVMYQTYFDESGIDKADACVVAGFLAGIPAFTVLRGAWDKVLQRYKVPDFHSVQFYAPASKIKKSTTNPYRGWSKMKRDMFIDALMKAIELANVFLVGCGVDSIAFHNRSQEERHMLTGGVFNAMSKKWTYQGKPSAPYFLAMRGAIECAGIMTEKAEEPNSTVSFIMSKQNEYERGAMLMYDYLLDMKPPLPFRQVLLKPVAFESPKDRAELQAADLAAYHLYQYVKERRINPDAIGTELLRRIVRCARNLEDLAFVTAGALDKLCFGFQCRRDEADKLRHLKLTRLRVKASHEPSECKIIGTVDESGKFCPSGLST